MTTFCLVVAGLFVLASVTLLGLSFRRNDNWFGLLGMTAMIVSAIPAAGYATMAG
jgi:hypothetical protein